MLHKAVNYSDHQTSLLQGEILYNQNSLERTVSVLRLVLDPQNDVLCSSALPPPKSKSAKVRDDLQVTSITSLVLHAGSGGPGTFYPQLDEIYSAPGATRGDKIDGQTEVRFSAVLDLCLRSVYKCFKAILRGNRESKTRT
jgi:hypothetical protein